MINGTYAIIACSQSKREGVHEARYLYKGQRWRKKWRFAEAVVEEYRINSAKHGLLKPTESIEEYDKYVGDFTEDERQEWLDQVTEQIRAWLEPKDSPHVYLIGGKSYRGDRIKEAVRQAGGTPLNPFFDEKTGQHKRIGEQNHWLLEMIQEHEDSEPTVPEQTELGGQND